MKVTLFAILMTISGAAFAQLDVGDCAYALTMEPTCISKINAELYCENNWFNDQAVSEVGACMKRLENNVKDISDRQRICTDQHTVTDRAQDNENRCN